MNTPLETDSTTSKALQRGWVLLTPANTRRAQQNHHTPPPEPADPTPDEIRAGFVRLVEMNRARVNEFIDVHGYDYYASQYLYSDEYYTTSQMRTDSPSYDDPQYYEDGTPCDAEEDW